MNRIQGAVSRTIVRSAPLERVVLAANVAVAVLVWAVFLQGATRPVDGWAFYSFMPSAPYVALPTSGPDGVGAYPFVYSPPVAAFFSTLHALPFAAFVALIRAAELAVLLWCARSIFFGAILLAPVASEVNAANVNLILVGAILAGFRWPAAWAIPLLTKPTLGVGLVWFVARREWRSLGIALGVTAAISAISFAAAPGQWRDWFDLLGGYRLPGSDIYPWTIWERLPIAIPLVIWGARTNRRWTVVVAAVIAMPRLYFMTPAMLVGLLPFVWATLPRVRAGLIRSLTKRDPSFARPAIVPEAEAPAA